MDTHARRPDHLDHSHDREADTEEAAHLGVQSVPAGSLILEDIGNEEEEVEHKQKGKLSIFFWMCVAWLAIVVFMAVFAPILPVKDPNAIDVPNKLAGIGSPDHLLGADGLGRDLLSRVVFGARVSVTISLSAVLTGMIVGGTLGMMAGYLRGRFEQLTMGAVNVLLAFPGIILLLALVAFVGQSLGAVTAAVAFLSIPIYTRIARATTLAVSQREFVLAAKALGAKKSRILFKEIAPNVFLPVAAFGLIALGTVIVLEGTLAFLGLSVQPPAATWGSTIAEGKRHLGDGIYHVALVPSFAMFFTVFSLNFVGDALRNRFDVRESQL